jgi:hypothetical protein
MRLLNLLFTAALATSAWAQPRNATVRVNFGEKSGTLDIQRIALGQGGLSQEPMWEDRMTEIRALRPKLIRPEMLDATAPSYDENARLRPLDPSRVEKGDLRTQVDLDAYGIAFWSFEPTR